MIIWLRLYGANISGYSLKKDNNYIFNYLKLHKNINFYEGNILNKNRLKKFIKSNEPDIIFHLAAEPIVIDCFKDPIRAFSVNTLGTLNLLQILKDLNIKKRFQLNIITTDKVYKNTNKKKKFTENDNLGGDDPYSASKACAEIISRSYYESYLKDKLSMNTFRAGNIIGGGDWSNFRLIPDIFISIYKKKKLIIRNPKHIRPWQHIFDVINAYLKISQKTFGKNNFENWNIGPSQKKMFNVIEILKIINGFFEAQINYKVNKHNNFEKKYLTLETKKIRKLNIKNKLDINKSLILTAEWYKNFFTKKDKLFSERQLKQYLKI